MNQSSVFGLSPEQATLSLEASFTSDVDFWFQSLHSSDSELSCLSAVPETQASSSSGYEGQSESDGSPQSGEEVEEEAEIASAKQLEATSEDGQVCDSASSVLNCPVFENENLGKLIWQTTTSYLAQLQTQVAKNDSQCLLDLIASLAPQAQASEGLTSHDFVLIMHALRVSESMAMTDKAQTSVPHREKRSKCSKRSAHAKLHSHQHTLKSVSKTSEARSDVVRVRGKTGRKPQAYACFLCGEVLPYRVALIKHFQDCHHLKRSQSLLYKRIRQGPECMKRLYHLH